jgi:hypothetical protein
MKNLSFFSTLALTILLLSSCEKLNIEPDSGNATNTCEDGWGVLRVTNKSNLTVQKISISGTNYGTIDLGEVKTIELPVGKYTVEINGISGGTGCSPSDVNIPDCGIVGRSCSY